MRSSSPAAWTPSGSPGVPAPGVDETRMLIETGPTLCTVRRTEASAVWSWPLWREAQRLVLRVSNFAEASRTDDDARDRPLQ